MSFFANYLNQAKSNYDFLELIDKFEDYWDWKVTVSFYVAVHLIHAHIEINYEGEHYLSHSRVDKYINPWGNYTKTRLPKNVYISYKKLYNLSRRSRYLVSDKDNERSLLAGKKLFLTDKEHYDKARIHLNTIVKFVNKQYRPTHFITMK